MFLSLSNKSIKNIFKKKFTIRINFLKKTYASNKDSTNTNIGTHLRLSGIQVESDRGGHPRFKAGKAGALPVKEPDFGMLSLSFVFVSCGYNVIFHF